MRDEPMHDHGPLCGRDDELARLVTAWREVEAGHGPRLEVLLAETGMGKTRLVQEFYAAIANSAIAEGEARYWPARLGREGANLLLNPHLEGVDEEAAPPFLWWGMRLVDPTSRNMVASGAVAPFIRIIETHGDALQRGRRRRSKWLETASRGARTVVNALPGGNLLELPLNLVEFARSAQSALRMAHESLEAIAKRHLDELNERVLDLVGEIVRERRGEAGLPIVCVFDDAQFGPDDPGAVDLFAKLLYIAVDEHWPVMLILTHWPREWNEQASAPNGRTFAALTKRIWEPHRIGWEPITLRAVAPTALRPMLRANLPGLTPSQEEQLLERAAGQPGLLDEIMHVCREGADEFFVAGDARGAFRKSAFAAVLSMSTNFERLAARRIQQLPHDVKALVSLASGQGMRFAPELTPNLAKRLKIDAAGLGGALSDEAFERAKIPHEVFMSDGGYGFTFAHRALFHAARQRLQRAFDLERSDIDAAWRAVLMDALPTTAATARARFLLELATDALPGSSDARERRAGAHALVRLTEAAWEKHDLHVAARLATRVWRGVQERTWAAADLGTANLIPTYSALRTSENPGAAIPVAEALVALAASARERFDALGKLGDALKDVSRQAEAKAAHREAFALVASEAARAPAGAWVKELGWAHFRLGLHAHDEGHRSAAIEHFEASRAALTERWEGERTSQALRDVARVLTFLARETRDVGDFDRALAYAEAGMTANRELSVREPSLAHDRGLSIALGMIGDIQLKRGEIEAALGCYQNEHEIAERACHRAPTAEHQRGLAISLGRLCDAHLARGDAAAALEWFERSHAISIRLDTATSRTFREGTGYASDRLGKAYRALGRSRDALDSFHRAATVWDGLGNNKYRMFAQTSIDAALQIHAALPASDQAATQATRDALLALQQTLRETMS